MNIFYLSKTPKVAASYHCDKHVVKMILETAQILSTVHWECDGEPSIDCYKPTHKNHPCTVWARQSNANYQWLYTLLFYLCREYTERYSKIHKVESSGLLYRLRNKPYELNEGEFIDPPKCMPDEYKIEGNTVESYRNYYKKAKAHLCKWYKHEDFKPSWWMSY